MLDTIEAFIAETYVQLAATEAMCYSTSCHATVLLSLKSQLRVCDWMNSLALYFVASQCENKM